MSRPFHRCIRSIPARAGEPFPLGILLPIQQVYPRVCGGATTSLSWGSPVRGLSPRVRGSRASSREHDRHSGSIPACAGEPPSQSPSWLSWPVYPRVCGGALNRRLYQPYRLGLSPRVRGSRYPCKAAHASEGSIPARAGEPPPKGRAQIVEWVYPRACGGTSRPCSGTGSSTGLSPRVRGNLGLPVRGLRLPAVYPRACGGTWAFLGEDILKVGLSPRVAGEPCRC